MKTDAKNQMGGEKRHLTPLFLFGEVGQPPVTRLFAWFGESQIEVMLVRSRNSIRFPRHSVDY